MVNDQEKREKVINGLECCSAYDYRCNDCPYQDDGGAEDDCYSDELYADALALLKTQEPRMMTLEEAFHNANTYRTSPDSVKPVFVQFRFEEYADEGLCPPWRGGVNQRALLEHTGAYGRDYVFWTDRPTKEQMEAVQWPDA